MRHALNPLMQNIGRLWRQRALKIAHEHLASAVVRTVLGNLWGAFAVSESEPNIIVTTPAGQRHELGALIVAITAASEGWRVTYLGPDLRRKRSPQPLDRIGRRRWRSASFTLFMTSI